MDEPLNAVIAQRVEVAPSLVVLRVAPDGWIVPDFKPGQYTVLGLPGSAKRSELSIPEEKPAAGDKLIKRAYSIASSSVAKEYMEFYVALVTSGALTPRLFALGAGDHLWLSSKTTGMFTLDQVPAGQHIVMIATGTGLAPYMSMLRTELVRGDTRRIAVIHGARYSWELGYRSELMTMAHLCPDFTYIPCISRPADDKAPWTGLTGHVQAVWGSQALERAWGFKPSPANTHIFLCGNPAMIEDMIIILKGQGYNDHKPRAPGNIHCERYW